MQISSSANDKFHQVLSQVSHQKISRKKASEPHLFNASSRHAAGTIHGNRKTTLEEKFSKYFRD